MLSNKKVLVTGGCGFIGEKLVKQLLNYKNNVIVIDVKKNIFSSDVTYFQKNLTKLNNVVSIFNGVDIVYHLASDISIKYCIENPNTSLYNNILLNNNVLESCRVNNVKRLVFSSTAAVYKQKKTNQPYKETSKLEPLNPYSLSKLYGEQLCEIYYKLYGLETIILRYFNVYGNKKISSNTYSNLINNFLHAYKNKSKLYINGTGNQTRDFVHVDDVVHANILSSNINLKKYGIPFNIGSGTSISVLKIANNISNNICFKPEAKGELMYSEADITKAKKILRWQPQKKLINWLKEQL